MEYTDIAAELYPRTRGNVPRGVKLFTASASGINLTRVDILREGLRREKGSYITLELPNFACIDDQNEAYVLAIAGQLRALLPKDGLVLVAGIGNRAVTADALGPAVADGIFATRLIAKQTAKTLQTPLRAVAAFVPGVQAMTGLDVTEQLRSLVNALQPVAVLCIDSLCTADARRLGCSVQLSTAGLSPRGMQSLSQKTLGVPVIAVGVPTVMEAHVPHTSGGAGPLVITPKEIDAILRRGAALLALSINKALQPALRVGELAFLTS
ncbi:MAG: GPR endopeptidase [Ruthenibacterium sp.]